MVVSSAKAMIACARPSLAPLRQRTSSSGVGGRRQSDGCMNARGRLAELLGAPEGRIAVRPGVGVRVGDRLDDRGGRRLIRVAHAEVDEVGATRPGFGLELVEPGENVGGKVGQPPCWNQLGPRGTTSVHRGLWCLGAVQYSSLALNRSGAG